MNNEHDESCNAYGPVPDEADQYKPNASAKATWAQTMARIAHDERKDRDAK